MKGGAFVSRWLAAPGCRYGWAVQGMLRGLGLVYFFSFWSLAAQAPALFGPRGLSPMGQTLSGVRGQVGSFPYVALPTWFWISDSYAMLMGVMGIGALAGLLMLFGRAPWWMNLLAWSAQVSLLHVSGPWMQHQGDALLAEVGFVALFLASPRWPRMPDPADMSRRMVGIWMCNLLLFKVMFSSGWIKLTGGDPFWLRETALNVFFETQPLPAATAWFFHLLPGGVLTQALWAVMFIELALPFYVFFPRVFRSMAAAGFAGLMLLVYLTGNHGGMPWLVILLALTLVDDRTWREILPEGRGPAVSDTPLVERRPSPTALTWLALWGPLCVGFVWSAHPEAYPPPWRQTARVMDAAGSMHRYGMFGRVRPQRFEIEIQGSMDGQHWREYLFKSKPGHPQRLPRLPAPHFPRLDWMFYEVAGGVGDPLSAQRHPWLGRLAEGLLANNPQTVSLLEVNPFPDHPPVYLRLVTYEVRYADPVTRRERGVWWVRTVRGLYMPVVRRVAPPGLPSAPGGDENR